MHHAVLFHQNDGGKAVHRTTTTTMHYRSTQQQILKHREIMFISPCKYHVHRLHETMPFIHQHLPQTLQHCVIASYPTGDEESPDDRHHQQQHTYTSKGPSTLGRVSKARWCDIPNHTSPRPRSSSKYPPVPNVPPTKNHPANQTLALDSRKDPWYAVHLPLVWCC